MLNKKGAKVVIGLFLSIFFLLGTGSAALADSSPEIKLTTRYIIYDPVSQTMITDTSNNLNGWWRGTTAPQYFCIDLDDAFNGGTAQSAFDQSRYYQARESKYFPEMFEGNLNENQFSLTYTNLNTYSDANPSIGGELYGHAISSWNINNQVSHHLTIRDTYKYDESVVTSEAIPFYVKAPKVEVRTDAASLQEMLAKQVMTGTGQAGDTVIIKEGSQVWTGSVDNSGDFSVNTPGLRWGFNVMVTETNGTGELSRSAPLEIPLDFNDPIYGKTPTQLTVGGTFLPVSPGGTPSTTIPGTVVGPIPQKSQWGILFAPTTFDFGPLKDGFELGTAINKTLTTDQYVGIGDTRQNTPGWALTAQATILKNGDIPLTGDISMEPSIKHVSYDGKNYHLDDNIPTASVPQTPMTPHTSDLILGGSSVTVMNAKKGSGSGMWAADLSNVTLNASETSNLTTGTYTGSVIWNLSNAPEGND